MSSYCTTAAVELWLPTDHGFSAGELAGFVTQASGMVNARLRPIYRTPLPDVTATPATPADIQDITSRLAGYLANVALSIRNKLDDVSATELLRQQAVQDLSEYLPTSNRPALRQIPNEIVTGEAMTFTDDDDDTYTYDEWKLVNSVWRIDPDTVQISGLELWKDFDVRWSAKHRGWILTRFDRDEIPDSGATVSYEYAYFPNASELAQMVAPESMRMYRA